MHDEVALNVSAVVDLTAALLPPMVRRGRGAVINVASTAAFQSLPYMAVYGATNTVSTLLSRLAPRRVVIRAARRLLSPQK